MTIPLPPVPPFLKIQGERPITPDQQRRMALTLACHDCDELPRVSEAGSVHEQGEWPVQIMHNGLRMALHCYYGPWNTQLVEKLRGHHEPQEEKAFAQVLSLLGNAQLMVELGAYWSYYSLWFRKCFPDAKSILVEPDPHCLEIGQYNFALNGCTGEFVHAAVAASSGVEPSFFCETYGVTRTVDLVSVDQLLHDQPRADIILADIQGAEWSMLQGMSRTLAAGKARIVIISTHHANLTGDYLTHEKCLDFLRGHGAVILAEHTVEESYSGDGLIVASFDPTITAPIEISYCRARDSWFGLPSGYQQTALEANRAANKAQAQLGAVSQKLAGIKKEYAAHVKSLENQLEYHSVNPARALRLWWNRFRTKF